MAFFFKGKFGWTVSTSERLQCYAYTACTIILFLPGGFKIEDICSPAEHIICQKVFALDDKHIGKSDQNKQGVSLSPVTATPLRSNPLQLLSNTQVPDALQSPKSPTSKVKGTGGEMSPTLPWPKHDLQSSQVGDQNSHFSDRIYKPTETKTDDTKPGIANSKPFSNGSKVDCEPAKSTNILSPVNQPDPKDSQVGVIKPQVEGQISSAPENCLSGQLSPAQSENRCALYVGEKLISKLVTAESCVSEGIPDPQNSGNFKCNRVTLTSRLQHRMFYLLGLLRVALLHVSGKVEV